MLPFARDLIVTKGCRTPTSVLLSTLTSFLQTDTAPWLKSAISGELSRVPLRQDGVLQTIHFIASQLAPSLGKEAQDQASSGPHFTVQAIMQISQLLSSVPRDMDPDTYFLQIAPQLLALLDGADLDLRRTAAYVIGNGVLGKRAYGAPGKIGHSIFVEPIFKVLTGTLDSRSRKWMQHYAEGEAFSHSANGDLEDQVLVGESTVRLAVERLEIIALQHPNPGLVKRLVSPILLPLWGLACFALEEELSTMHEKVMSLLQTFFGISVGLEPLQKLCNNLLYDGGATWSYCRGRNNGVSLRSRKATSTDPFNFVQLMDALECRTELFVKLLSSDPRSEERTGDIFLFVSRAWLLPSEDHTSSSRPAIGGETDESESTVRKLVSAKIAGKLLDNFKDILSRRPLRILELIKQLIDGELGQIKAGSRRRQGHAAGGVSLSSLSNIVSKEENGLAEDGSAQGDSTELLSAVFSLLSTILASPGFSPSQEIRPILENIKSALDQLLPQLPSSLSKPGTTASMLLEVQLVYPEEQEKQETAQKPSHISDLDTHRQALTNLNSDMPPVQAEGLSLLSDLIKKSSPVLDVPSTLTLLMSIITDPVSESAANEEFIYLNAIKLIGTLASKHSRTVVKTLVEQYADRTEERTLNQRLKIGESLLRTVQDLGEALTGDTARIFGEGMISVAGRRGQKPEMQKRRKQQLEKEQRERDRESRKQDPPLGPGWRIPSPEPSTSEATHDVGQHRDDGDDDSETPEQAAFSAKTLSAWVSGAAADENPDDLRARTSAISILATAVQTNILGLGPSIASSSVDLALSILTLEPDPESAILRRASIVLILDILKALDTARETRGAAAVDFGFSLTDVPVAPATRGHGGGPATIGNIPHMLRTLRYVEDRETDGIARGHIRVLIESLEAWSEKSLLWGVGTHDRNRDMEERLELGDRIAGLSVSPLAGREGNEKPRIEEIE